AMQNAKPEKNKTSGSKHFQSSQSSSVGFLPQQKKMSTSMKREDFPSLPHTLKTTAVEKKENTTSFTQSFTTIVQSKKTTSLTSGNVLLTESKTTIPSLYNIRDRHKHKRGEQISRIIQNLNRYNKYKVYGYWECSVCEEKKVKHEQGYYVQEYR
ncbi:20126_t:CDS:1, partial [Racocetra fulgida]